MNDKVNVKQVILGTLAVTAVALAFWFIFRFHNVVLMFFAAIIISTAFQPLVRRLNQWGVPQATGVILLYMVLLILIGAVFWLGSPFIVNQTANITTTLSDTYHIARQEIANSANLLVRRLALALPPTLSFISAAPTEDTDVITSLNSLTGTVMTGFRALLGVIATFLLAFYWTLESERIKLSLLLLVPKEKRDSAREIVKGIEDKLSSYVIGQGVLCLVIGTMALIAYVIIGLPHALILAILAGIMEAVPLIGPTLGAVPAVLVALSSGRLDVLWVIVSTVVIQQLENNLLVPRIMDKAIGIRPLVTLLAMLGFGSLFGIVGVLVAIPLAAVIQLILGRFVLQPGAEVENVGRDKASVLRYQVKDFVEDIRGQVRRKTTLASADMDRIEDSLESIAVDLDGLLVRLNGKQEKEDEAIS